MDSESQKNELCQAFGSYLKEKGGRFTPERAEIIQAMQQCETHFTLENLRAFLVEAHFRVSQATLYNTLNEMVTAGFAVRFSIKEKTYYEVSYKKSRHCHQVCTNCGRIAEFYNQDLEKMVREIKYKRFSFSDYSLLVYGTCSVCKAKMKRASKKKNTKNNIEK